MEINWGALKDTAKNVSSEYAKAKAEEAKWGGIATCVMVGGILILATVGILTDPTRKKQDKGE